MSKPVKIVIKDVHWTLEVLEDKKYEEEHGKDSHGITDKSKLKVDLKLTSLSQALVRHELLHVYVSSCCINSIDDMDDSGMEELCAEIVEFHLEDMAKHSKSLYSKLKSQAASLLKED